MNMAFEFMNLAMDCKADLCGPCRKTVKEESHEYRNNWI